MFFLRIENKVKSIPDIDIVCTVGESTSRESDSSIGQFGTGFLYSLALFAREGILGQCKICFGKDVYSPHITKGRKRDSAGNSRDMSKIVLKKQNGPSYDLNISTGFGEMDWDDVTMGIRELVSNAFDGALTHDNSYSSVAIARVAENECRAKDGMIRVYIPITPEIDDYIVNLDRYFICSKKTYNPDISVLPKATPGPCLVYRKGVLVSQFGDQSLFDYNINDIPIDESRNISEYQSMQYIARAIVLQSRQDQLDKYIRDVIFTDYYDNPFWEKTISSYRIDPSNFDAKDRDLARNRLLQAVKNVIGDGVLCNNEIERLMLLKKGINGVIPRNIDAYKILTDCGASKASDYLNDSESLGNTLSEPTPRVIEVLNKVWDKILDFNLTNGRNKPPIQCFNSAVNSGCQTFGYCNSDYSQIFIHEDISNDMGAQLITVMIEEVTHYVAKTNDYTRDFQSFVVNLAARLMM